MMSMKCGSASSIVSEEESTPLFIDFCRPSKLKEEALVGTVWGTHIGRSYESVIDRQQNGMNT